jgi:anti-sigma regulatory factor (Ser/Thr protein kinase)
MTADPPAAEASCGLPAGAAGQQDGIPGGPPPLDQLFDSGSLYLLRSAVAAHASAAGLSPLRVYDVVAAAHELAANAVRHGAGHGRLRLRCDGPVLYCEVSDDGPAARNGKPGPGPGGDPGWPVEHGHGLWMIGQVADTFGIDHGPAGTTATACFTVSPSPAGDGAATSEGQERPADHQER